MPRLFTGLEIPQDIACQLDLMRGGLPGARWIDQDCYHITLRFIGDIEDGLAREIADALDGLAALPFTLQLKGLGYFGGSKPHSLHARIAQSSELMRLQATHERICQSLGLRPESRKFTPHVTVARLKGTPAGKVEHFIADRSLFESRPFEVSQFVLFSSRPSRGGGPYTVEGAYPLHMAM